MTRRIAQLADVMHQETGKPHGDALLEAALAIDHLAWAAGHAAKVLRRRRVSSGLVMANQAATVEYRPLGVIGVIGPWNYPVFTPMGSIAYALAAGNAVVFKPQRVHARRRRVAGRDLRRGRARAPGAPGGHRPRRDRRGAVPLRRRQGRVHRLDRHRQAGDGRLRRDADAGGHRGRRQGRPASSTRTPTSRPPPTPRCGAACANAGQTCTGVERVYVHERVYDDVPRRPARRRDRRRGRWRRIRSSFASIWTSWPPN